MAEILYVLMKLVNDEVEEEREKAGTKVRSHHTSTQQLTSAGGGKDRSRGCSGQSPLAGHRDEDVLGTAVSRAL